MATVVQGGLASPPRNPETLSDHAYETFLIGNRAGCTISLNCHVTQKKRTLMHHPLGMYFQSSHTLEGRRV